MSSRTLRITLLASEWKSSKGGLSTMNRELAIQLAKHHNVSVSFLVPKCSDEDKREARSHNVNILEAKERPGFEQNAWLAFPPEDLAIDFVVGHGVILGKQAPIIRDSHHCQWVQVVHTAPYELAMYKTYPGAISKGNEKQRTELILCKMADLVIAVGPKLVEFYTAHLSSCGKKVYNFTPGIFTELSSLKLSSQSGKFRLLVFGRGDSEDFKLKGYDIAAQAVAKLNDKSFHLTFVGAPIGNEDQVTEKLLKLGLDRSQLIVEGYLEDREYLVMLLCASNLVVAPSRTEGFGLTALEALSAGLPFLVSQNSGFGEAVKRISPRSTFIVDSEDPEEWAEAIKRVRQKGGETAIQECQELRERYAAKYSWKRQIKEFLSIMLSSSSDGSSHEAQYTYVDNTARDRQEARHIRRREIEQEARRRKEEIERLRLENELSLRRAELFDYKFGNKTRLDSFRGLPIDDVTQLRIGVFGPVGSGKSSFINTCERVVTETEKGSAFVSITGLEGTLFLEDYLPEMFFHLVDTRPFFNYSAFETVEFQKILYGILQPGDKVIRNTSQDNTPGMDLHPCPDFANRMHGVIFVFQATDPRLRAGAYEKNFRDILRKIGIAPITIITHFDKLKTEEEYKNVRYEASKATGSEIEHTFFVNCAEDYRKRNPEKQRVIFDILNSALLTAERAVKIMKQEQYKEDDDDDDNDEMMRALEKTSISGKVTPDTQEASVKVFLRFLQKENRWSTDSLTDVLNKLSKDDVTSVQLLAWCWRDVRAYFLFSMKKVVEKWLRERKMIP